MHHQNEIKLGDIIFSLILVGALTVATLGVGIWIIFHQVLGWLQTGHWAQMTLADGMSIVHWPLLITEWVGVQQIFDWIEGCRSRSCF